MHIRVSIYLVVLRALSSSCLFRDLAQKRVGDLTLVYNSAITNTQDSSKKINSTTGYYLKGNLSRCGSDQ